MWKDIDDENVLHVWENPNTQETVEVNPNYYESNGIPCDGETGEEYIYVKTIVKV